MLPSHFLSKLHMPFARQHLGLYHTCHLAVKLVRDREVYAGLAEDEETVMELEILLVGGMKKSSYIIYFYSLLRHDLMV